MIIAWPRQGERKECGGKVDRRREGHGHIRRENVDRWPTPFGRLWCSRTERERRPRGTQDETRRKEEKEKELNVQGASHHHHQQHYRRHKHHHHHHHHLHRRRRHCYHQASATTTNAAFLPEANKQTLSVAAWTWTHSLVRLCLTQPSCQQQQHQPPPPSREPPPQQLHTRWIGSLLLD